MTDTQKQRAAWNLEDIARAIAADIADGSFVNLGIGRPEAIANYIPADKEIIFHTENGLLGMGPAPDKDHENLELINAGKKPVTAVSGASFIHQADSLAMIRGSHIDVCVMGAFQVSASGDLANWSTGQALAVPAVDGVMDLSSGAKKIFIMMTHVTKYDAAKLVDHLTYPATSRGMVSRVYTDLAIIDIINGAFHLRDIVPGLTFDELQAHTDAPLLKIE